LYGILILTTQQRDSPGAGQRKHFDEIAVAGNFKNETKLF
jgi:hypothetical protein